MIVLSQFRRDVGSTSLEIALEPASTAVPAAAAEQQNENYDDEKRGRIHVRRPSLRAFGTLHIAQPEI